MRINSVIVRNYRVHRELNVTFDPSFTVIGGPNECGKSTLVEAIHRALFLKAKVTGTAHQTMRSDWWPGHPEVEVAFTAGGQDYVIVKRFSGLTGTARLQKVGGEAWQGDEAEDQLASLLRVEPVGGGRGVGDRVNQQWSHLWVWQGSSGQNPSEHASSQKDALLQRLQTIGGAAALQSELDSQVAERFAAAKEEIYLQSGNAKAGSDLDKALKEAEHRETDRLQAAERVEKLYGAIRDFDEATRAIAQANADLQNLNRQSEELASKLARVEELRLLEARQSPEVDVAAVRYRTLADCDTQIRTLRTNAEALEATLQPKTARLKVLENGVEQARQRSAQSAQDYEQAVERTRKLRARRDVAAAFVVRFEKQTQRDDLQAKCDEAHRLQGQLNKVNEQLATLPKVDATMLKTLQDLERRVNESEIALKAMAAKIEVISATEPVRVGGTFLAAGQSHVIADQTEVALGDALLLRISPGGGQSLQEASSQLQASRQERRAQLDALAVASVTEAVEIATQRETLLRRVENFERDLQAMDAVHLPERLAAAQTALAAAEAEVARRLPHVEDFAIPADPNEATKRRTAEETDLERADSEETVVKTLRDKGSDDLSVAQHNFANQQQTVRQEGQQLAGTQAQIRLLVETHGNDADRARALTDAHIAMTQAEDGLARTRRELSQLQPEQLAKDQERLHRAINQSRQAKADAQTRLAVAEAQLRSEGTDDPEADLALANARAEAAATHLASIRRQCEAIRLLHQLFSEEQRALAQQFSQPFAERISAYLQCLFGSGCRAEVTLDHSGFQGLHLVRSSEDGGTTGFDGLSGGAREQVAAAVRLAMADLLAADHGGCLPVVFDDAFAYSDPERVQALQRMLDLAADRGLQLIILTCNPSDYAALGARQVLLRSEPPKHRTDQQRTEADLSEEIGPHAVREPTGPGTEQLRQALLGTLKELGGRAGNMTLRDTLGWDETTYNAVKADLVGSGMLAVGRGRGGTVALPGAGSEEE